MSCEVSWVPDALAVTLRCVDSAQPIIAWLSTIRDSTEEYDTLITVRPESPESEEERDASTSPDSAFDEILSQLGKEIYKLDEYQKKFAPPEQEISLSILNIFDECLDQLTLNNKTSHDLVPPEEDSVIVDEADYSDGESTLSNVSFVTSTPVRTDKIDNNSFNNPKICIANESDTNLIFDKGKHAPVPFKRTRLKTTSSVYENMEVNKAKDADDKKGESASDSESTCWSYKECSDDDVEPKDRYAAVWAHRSGYHKSDEILKQVLSQNKATISRLSFDETSEFTPTQYNEYSLHEVGDRCVDIEPTVATMTPEKPADDGYEPVRDAITPDENIYEEIEFGCGYSYPDEGYSCGDSIEVESCSISASSEGIGRESPLYTNLRDHAAYAIPEDVRHWRSMLWDPFYCDDEEDEWISPGECAVYAQEQRPPLVIPRITQHRPHREQRTFEDTSKDSSSVKSSVKEYGRLHDWSPSSERAFDERNYSRAIDSPTFGRIHRRLGTSTENLLVNHRTPNNIHHPASSSGDSLDVEVRVQQPAIRTRKVKSMVAPKPMPRTILAVHPQSEVVLLEGPVKRTMFTRHGKKTKKNWTECYMILTSTALVCYKDQKTYCSSSLYSRARGASGAGDGGMPELVLNLMHAHVVPCIAAHTRRHNRSFSLMVNYDTYLIQDESEDRAKQWLSAIQTVVYELGPPPGDESGAIAVPTDRQMARTPDSIRTRAGTPDMGRIYRNKIKAGGNSNEELSDSTDPSIQKIHIKSRLRNFFAKRPAMESLVKRGIYKDEPVFGRNLEEVCPSKSPRVPEFVKACINEIESSVDNMCTDGLYRASGNLSQVQKIRLQVDQNDMTVIERNTDIHVLTGSLKLFFRELKEPLIPCSMFDRVLAACSIKPREVRAKEFREIVQALPQCNRETLRFLLEHLLKVTQYSDKNRMATVNLAIVFGPTLLWAPAEQAHNIAVDCIQQNFVVEVLLTDFKDIFDDTTDKKKT